jgi:hypothetical protein
VWIVDLPFIVVDRSTVPDPLLTFSQADIYRDSRLRKQYPALHAPTVLDSITLPTMTFAVTLQTVLRPASLLRNRCGCCAPTR